MFDFFLNRLKSFRPALAGFRNLVIYEKNTWVHLAATILVIGMGAIFHISIIEWALVLTAVFAVWFAEAINTIIEYVMNHLEPGYHPKIKIIKDISASAVLLAAFYAIIIGLLIFIPKLIK